MATSKAVAVADAAAAATSRGRLGWRGERGEGRIIVSEDEYGARKEGSCSSPMSGPDVGGTRDVMDTGNVVAPAASSISRIEGRGEGGTLVSLSTSHDEMKGLEENSKNKSFASGAFSTPCGAAEETSATAVHERVAGIGNGDSVGRGRGGVVSLATSAPGVAWRAVWGSARAVGATVGIGSGASRQMEKARVSRHRGGSSHAVLIL